MQFVRFPSIENLSMAKELNNRNFQTAHSVESWVVTEKIDGANIQLYFDIDGNWALGNRNALLDKEADNRSFYNAFDHMEGVQEVINKCCTFMTYNEKVKQEIIPSRAMKQLILYGEFYGSKVMNRLNYNCKYGWKFFALTIINYKGQVQHLPYVQFETFMENMGLKDFMVPVLADDVSFEEACAYANDGITRFAGTEGRRDVMEGVVIEPLFATPVSELGNYRFKNKSDDFVETHNKKRAVEKPTPEETELQKLNQEFRGFCTESRMWSVFSKLGMPQSGKDTGKYLGAFIQDAWEDFLKVHPELEEIETKDRKSITNIGSTHYVYFEKVRSQQGADTEA